MDNQFPFEPRRFGSADGAYIHVSPRNSNIPICTHYRSMLLSFNYIFPDFYSFNVLTLQLFRLCKPMLSMVLHPQVTVDDPGTQQRFYQRGVASTRRSSFSDFFVFFLCVCVLVAVHKWGYDDMNIYIYAMCRVTRSHPPGFVGDLGFQR